MQSATVLELAFVFSADNAVLCLTVKDWEERYPEIAANPKYDGTAVFVVESRNLGHCHHLYVIFKAERQSRIQFSLCGMFAKLWLWPVRMTNSD